MRAFLALLFLAFASSPAIAQQPSADETAIRELIARWYGELAKKDDGRTYGLTAPGYIEAARPYYHYDNGSAKLGPRVYTSFAATALQSGYDIDVLRIDPNFAKARVWERGYFFAAAAQKTYERGASTSFVFEKLADTGQWAILAHDSSSQGIPPNKITDPMPDLKALYYATEGKARDPVKDAEEARKF